MQDGLDLVSGLMQVLAIPVCDVRGEEVVWCWQCCYKWREYAI